MYTLRFCDLGSWRQSGKFKSSANAVFAEEGMVLLTPVLWGSIQGSSTGKRAWPCPTSGRGQGVIGVGVSKEELETVRRLL